MSPLLHRLLFKSSLGWLGFVLMLLPLVVPRRGIDLTLTTVIYFLGAYVAGMYIGRDLPRALLWLQRRWVYLAATALLSTVALIGVFA